MIRRDDFIRALGMPDPGFDRAVDAALLRARESEERPVMKKKMTFTVLLAAVFVLALTGAALAVGLNLFEYFGDIDPRLRVIAPETAVEDGSTLEIDTETLGTVKATVDSAYYDGRSLIVAYTIDNFRRYEYYEPTAAEFKTMFPTDKFYPDEDEAEPDQIEYVQKFQNAIDSGRPFGLVEYYVSPGDHSYTDDGVDLQPSGVRTEIGENGLLYCIREYETPLPEDAQERDSLALRMPLKLFTAWYYFDGEKYYEKYAQEPLGNLTATVRRTDAVTRYYAWEGELSGAKLKAEAQVSAVHVRLRIELEGGAFPDPAELWNDIANPEDTWYSFELSDSKGMSYSFSGGMEGEGVFDVEYDGLGYVPDEVMLTVRAECESEWNADRESEWDADAHILPGCPVVMKPE